MKLSLDPIRSLAMDASDTRWRLWNAMSNIRLPISAVFQHLVDHNSGGIVSIKLDYYSPHAKEFR